MLTVDSDDMITDVEYYDFRQLKLNWKGRKMAEKLDQNTLEYGMSIKNVNKTLVSSPITSSAVFPTIHFTATAIISLTPMQAMTVHTTTMLNFPTLSWL